MEINFLMLLASSVHDIKNNLCTVMASIDALSASNLIPSQAEEIYKIQSLTEGINAELMQLLAIYKFDNKQYALQIQEHNIKDFLEYQLSTIAPLLKIKKLQAELDCKPEYIGFFDENLMGGVIRNGLNNALKFAKTKIRISVQINQDNIIFNIQDDGPGFPCHWEGIIDENRTGIDFKSQSTGLGFFFSNQVAKVHSSKLKKAYIELRNLSTAHFNANFSFYLPR